MNTKKIQLTKVKRLWNFPLLTDGKQGRVFTKHYSNLAFILDSNHFALLSFLVYQSRADNTLEYSTKLLKMYQKSIAEGKELYGSKNESLNTYPPKLRDYFEYLIENGLLLPTSTPKQFLINPCLTYSKLYVKAEFYKEWVGRYELLRTWIVNGNLNDHIQNYLEHVDKKMKRRKQ